jgi:hypothetical protein
VAEAPAAIMRKLIQDPMYSFSGYRDQVTNDETTGLRAVTRASWYALPALVDARRL